jgi:hypothetical protein
MRHLLFLLGFALLASHEIDAALAAEWRLLYVLRGLPEPLAATAFTLVHVPLFAVLLWLLFHPQPRMQVWARRGFMAFLLVHAALHARLASHPDYGFAGWESNVLIFGAGLAGLLYLFAEVLLSRRAPA